MTLEMRRFLDEAPPTRERVERFLSDHQFPLVDGRRVTFVFHGQADRVNLRHFIYGLPSSQPLTRVPETDLWFVVMDLPVCSRVEYKIERIRGENREWMMDPLNPNLAHDPYGANSVCYGEGYETPDWTEPDSEARSGTFDELVLRSRAFESSRAVRVYLPARFRRRRRYPLLVVHDGEDYLRFAELKIVLDNLIHRLEIPPMIVALTQAGDRMREYGADRRHARFLADELLPGLGMQYPLLDTPRSRGLMGASFGAVAALHAAWRRPGVWGNLLVQSGSFAFSDIGEHGKGPIFDSVVEFVNGLREAPGRPADKIFVSCGIYEALIYENRSIVPLLQSTGMELRYVEARDGHNWDNWRDRLREGLSWLFPGPLWMVYE